MLFNKKLVFSFTGLSGSGKSTLASYLAKTLTQSNLKVFILDGDMLRNQTLNNGFSDIDRVQNISKGVKLARWFFDQGYFVILAFINPFESTRNITKNAFRKNEFIEIYVNTPMSICEKRDVKGLYKRARLGLLKNMTGIDSRYDIPRRPNITLDTTIYSPQENVNQIIDFIKTNNF